MPARPPPICQGCSQPARRTKGYRLVHYLTQRWHWVCWARKELDAAHPPRPVGRPSLGKGRGRDGTTIKLRVTTDEHARVTAHCEREGTTAAQLIRSRLADVLG